MSKETQKSTIGLDAEIEQLGSDIDKLSNSVDAYLLESARKRSPDPLTQAQVRALVLASGQRGARRAGQRTGFGIAAKTAGRLMEMELLFECCVSGNYFITPAGRRVLDFPENKRRADTMRRIGT